MIGLFSLCSLVRRDPKQRDGPVKRARNRSAIETQVQRRIAVFCSAKIIECRVGTSLKCKTFKLKMTCLKKFGWLEEVVGRLTSLWPDRPQWPFAGRVEASAWLPPQSSPPAPLDMGATSAFAGSGPDK
jgi:hypothetical protein